MKIGIVTGGTVVPSFVESQLKQEQYEYLIAVDRGADFFVKSQFIPDLMVGDFDSVDKESLREMELQLGGKVMQYPPEKDDTDTELAIKIALEKGATQIDIYGGTGTRLDHVLGNIQLLMTALKHKVPCQMIDEHNRIRMIDEFCEIEKKEQYGKYVSIIPFTPRVKGITLTGLKYPLDHYTLDCGRALGVSNEIVEDKARITLEEGILLLIESKD